MRVLYICMWPWPYLTPFQTSTSVSWATGCAETASVSTWWAATSASATLDTNPLRADWNASVGHCSCVCAVFVDDAVPLPWPCPVDGDGLTHGIEHVSLSVPRHRWMHHWERRLWDVLHQLRGKLRVQLSEWLRPDAWPEELHRSASLSVGLSLRLSVSFFLYRSIWFTDSVSMSFRPSVCLSLYPPICLPLSPHKVPCVAYWQSQAPRDSDSLLWCHFINIWMTAILWGFGIVTQIDSQPLQPSFGTHVGKYIWSRKAVMSHHDLSVILYLLH